MIKHSCKHLGLPYRVVCWVHSDTLPSQDGFLSFQVVHCWLHCHCYRHCVLRCLKQPWQPWVGLSGSTTSGGASTPTTAGASAPRPSWSLYVIHQVYKHKQTAQIDTSTDRRAQTGRQTQTDRPTDKQKDRQIDRHAQTRTHINSALHPFPPLTCQQRSLVLTTTKEPNAPTTRYIIGDTVGPWSGPFYHTRLGRHAVPIDATHRLTSNGHRA